MSQSEPLQVSKPSSIKFGSRLITLPVPGPDGPIVLRVVPLRPGELLGIVGGVQGLPEDPTAVHESAQPLPPDPANQPALVRRVIATFDEASARYALVARAAILEPEFSFGPEREEGKAWWGDVEWENQVGLVAEISRISGTRIDTNSPEGSAAQRTVRFPADGEGSGGGDAGAGDGASADGAAAR
jgi:hypothetical protein